MTTHDVSSPGPATTNGHARRVPLRSSGVSTADDAGSVDVTAPDGSYCTGARCCSNQPARRRELRPRAPRYASRDGDVNGVRTSRVLVVMATTSCCTRAGSLWEFHKAHHSAEVLSPLTDYRAHPLEILSTVLRRGWESAPFRRVQPRGRRCGRIWSMTDGCVMNATMREPPNATVKRRRRGGCPLLVRRSTGWTGRRSTPSHATSGAASITRTLNR